MKSSSSELDIPKIVQEKPKLIPMSDINAKITRNDAYVDGYQSGFKAGYGSADMSIPGMVLCGIGILALIISCIMVMRHSSRVVSILCKRFQLEIPKKTTQKLSSIILALIVCASLVACASKKTDVPELVEIQEAQSVTEKDGELQESDSAQVMIVSKPENSGNTTHGKDSPELKEILELENKTGTAETAVSKMRPSAIREAAQLATFQKAMSWRYGQLVDETERYCNIMDTAFNFSPLLLIQGQALIMPPVLAKAGASMRIEDGDTATSAKATYELLEPARYIASPPTWREFLMVDSFPEAEEPNPALLPRNSEERSIWRKAVREAWNEGMEQADQLYADNVSRMVREYRGIMLYHLLTAQHLLSKVGTASAELGRHASGNKLNIGQQVYRITRPSAFVLNPGKKSSADTRKGKGRI